MSRSALRVAAVASVPAIALAAALPSGAATAAPTGAVKAGAAAEPAPVTVSASGDKVTLNVTAPSGARMQILCEIRAHNPHYSHHAHAKNRHMVNTVAQVKCNHAMAKISLKVILFKNGNKQKYKETGWKTNYGRSSISNNAARRCIKKTRYMAGAYAWLTAPPRYTPRTAYIKAYSPIVYIGACKKQGS